MATTTTSGMWTHNQIQIASWPTVQLSYLMALAGEEAVVAVAEVGPVLVREEAVNLLPWVAGVVLLLLLHLVVGVGMLLTLVVEEAQAQAGAGVE